MQTKLDLPPLRQPKAAAAHDLVVVAETNVAPGALVTVWGDTVHALELQEPVQHLVLDGTTLFVCGYDTVSFTTHGGDVGWGPWESFPLPGFVQVGAFAASGDLCVVQTFQKDVWVFRRTDSGWRRVWERRLPGMEPALATDGNRIAVATRVGFPAPREEHVNQVLVIDFDADGTARESWLDLPLLVFPTSILLLGSELVICDPRYEGRGALLRCQEDDRRWTGPEVIEVPERDGGEQLSGALQPAGDRRFACTLAGIAGERLLLVDLAAGSAVATPSGAGITLIAAPDAVVRIDGAQLHRLRL